ncbi:TPA: hypothetical protein R1R37_005171 [Klebsiella aerogenes]|nr:hypothetical protein [Klebsiella aerogenes]HBY1606786.1 hypothetical protein [Klebsiella aerogenes]HBY1644071.1 hypothetical protein [Klebsiella aerogenes]HEC0404273.1 hypothetical protein [Klebsiella aerogenes]HEC1359307.1 hypothetical protein [Klebsiella aerogenes]
MMRDFFLTKCIVIFLLWGGVFFMLFDTFYPNFLKKNNEYYCHASVIEYAGRDKLHLTIDVASENDSASVSLKGKILFPDRTEHPFYIRRYFHYEIEGGVLSTKKSKVPTFVSRETDIDLLSKYFHNFFLNSEGGEFSHKIQRLSANSNNRVFFTTDKVPYAICLTH